MGNRGEWCKVKITNTQTTDPGQIKSLQIFYITRTDFRGPRAT